MNIFKLCERLSIGFRGASPSNKKQNVPIKNKLESFRIHDTDYRQQGGMSFKVGTFSVLDFLIFVYICKQIK